MRRLLLALVTPLLLAAAPDARGSSCSEGLRVDGVFLWGHGEPRGRLPAPAGRVAAAIPGCGDTEQVYDEPTTATRIRGIPPTIAVTRGGRLFIAEGVLAAMGAHPLRGIAPARVRDRCCRPHRTPLRGTVGHGSIYGFEMRAAGRGPVFLRVDRRTRYANRPALQPLLRPQRIRVRTSACGHRRVVDSITFLGRTVQPRRERLDIGPFHLRERPKLIAGALAFLLLLASLSLIIQARR